MLERVEASRGDSDTTFFNTLMYCGELLFKLTVCGMSAAVRDDKNRHRYHALYRLVRADGIGGWAQVLDEILTGPASQYLVNEARKEQKALTERLGAGTWQYETVSLLNACLQRLDASQTAVANKVDLRQWLSLFANLRNKTRGHGAPTAVALQDICPALEKSIRLFLENFPLFSREWAYLHRNLSGKYRVSKLIETANAFDYLRVRFESHEARPRRRMSSMTEAA
jgi:hypothetical protein